MVPLTVGSIQSRSSHKRAATKLYVEHVFFFSYLIFAFCCSLDGSVVHRRGKLLGAACFEVLDWTPFRRRKAGKFKLIQWEFRLLYSGPSGPIGRPESLHPCRNKGGLLQVNGYFLQLLKAIIWRCWEKFNHVIFTLLIKHSLFT